MYETSPTPVMSGMRQSCSGMYPIRSRTGTPSPMSRPRTFAVPAVGCSKPRRSRRNVVFPAPLGPTSPIAPSGILTVRSSTARTSPKTFVSPAVSTSTMIPSVFVAVRGGRSAWRSASLDSSFAAPPPEECQQEGDCYGHRDNQPDLNHAEAGGRARAVRVRPKTHLRRGGAVLIGHTLHVESDIVREICGLVAATRETHGNPREIGQRLIEFVCGEGAAFDRYVIAGEYLPTPHRRDIRLVLRTHRPAEDAERGLHLGMRRQLSRRILADIEIERWDCRHGGRRIEAEVGDERRRYETECDIGMVGERATRLDVEVRLILPEFGRGRREAPLGYSGPPSARNRERPVQEPCRPAIDADGRNRRIPREDSGRSDDVDVHEPDEPKLKRPLAGVESREGAQGGVEDIDPLIAGPVRRLVQGRSGWNGGRPDRRG